MFTPSAAAFLFEFFHENTQCARAHYAAHARPAVRALSCNFKVYRFAPKTPLPAAAAGLGSCAWGGFLDGELNLLLGVNGVNEAAVHCVFIGGTAQ